MTKLNTDSFVLVQVDTDDNWGYVMDEEGNAVESKDFNEVDELRIYHQPDYVNRLCVVREIFKIVEKG